MLSRDLSEQKTPDLGAPAPLVALLFARPRLLLVSALLGVIIGIAVPAVWGARASSTVALSVANYTAMSGQTLALMAQSTAVVANAAESLGESDDDVAANTSAEWQSDFGAVQITAVAPSEEHARERSFAVAESLMNTLQDMSTSTQAEILEEAESLLNAPLSDQDAEGARRQQLMVSMAERQSQLADQVSSASIVEMTDSGQASIPGPAVGAGIGLLVGLLFGGLASVLLGTRKLKVTSPAALSRVTGHPVIHTIGALPSVVATIVEEGADKIALIYLRGTGLHTVQSAEQIMVPLLQVHDKSVCVRRLADIEDVASFALIDHSVTDIDITIAQIQFGREGAALLAGRSDVSPILLARAGATSSHEVKSAIDSFRRVQPVVLIVGKRDS